MDVEEQIPALIAQLRVVVDRMRSVFYRAGTPAMSELNEANEELKKMGMLLRTFLRHARELEITTEQASELRTMLMEYRKFAASIGATASDEQLARVMEQYVNNPDKPEKN